MILPIVTETIAPALKQVQRELVLVVDYVPDSPISVHISRKRNFAQQLTDAKEFVLDPEVSHSYRSSITTETIKRGPARSLTVLFPDGTMIAEKSAVDTLMKVVKKIGVARVRKAVEDYGLKFCKIPVISNRRDKKYGKAQKDLGNGWLLMTHSNNPMKRDFINKLSDILDLGIRVELGE